jgi:hypothetical protein
LKSKKSFQDGVSQPDKQQKRTQRRRDAKVSPRFLNPLVAFHPLDNFLFHFREPFHFRERSVFLFCFLSFLLQTGWSRNGLRGSGRNNNNPDNRNHNNGFRVCVAVESRSNQYRRVQPAMRRVYGLGDDD